MMTRLALLALLALSVAGCPTGRADDDDVTEIPDDDDDATGDDDDATGDDDDSAGDDDDATGDDDDSAGDDDDATGDDDDSANEDADGDGSPASEDCDDNDSANFPGNTEVCDGQDNDCDADTTIVDVALEMAEGDTMEALDDVLLGNAWRVDADVVLTSFAQRLNAVDGQGLQWLVYEAASLAGPWTELASTSTTVPTADAGTTMFHTSGDFDLQLTAGNVYILGVYALGQSEAQATFGDAEITPVSFGAALGGIYGVGAGVPPLPDQLFDSLAARHPQRVTTEQDADVDGDGVPACAGDCNDGAANALPGGTEVACDWLDNDCDPGTTDCVGGVIISELYVDAFGSDSDQEWFELENDAGAAVDFEGWLLIDDDEEDEWVDSSVVIGVGGAAVFAQEGDTSLNGGVTADYVYGGAISLSNGGDELRLFSPLGEEIDAVVWDETTWPIQEGAALNLDPGVLDATSNDDPANWCPSLAPPFSGNATGTPGTDNASCMVPSSGAAAGDLVVTEVLQNPAGSDSDKEWFEIANTTGTAISLLGWQISDNEDDSFLVTQAIVVPANGFIVLGETTVAADNGGAPVSYGYGGNMTLGNGDDELVLTAPEGTEIDRVEWDGGPSFPDPDGATMSLHPGQEALNDLGTSWCTSTASTYGTNGDLGSPGAVNPSCPL